MPRPERKLAPRVLKTLAHIGANVLHERQRLGLTQEEVAEKADFDPRFFRFVERGKTNMTIETLVRLATALGVEPASLFRPTLLPEARVGRPRRTPENKKRSSIVVK